MTIKEKIKQLKEKYKEHLLYINYYRNRDFWTSGPNTGKGSKGTHYIYTYDAQFKDNHCVTTNNLDELEQKILERINSEVK